MSRKSVKQKIKKLWPDDSVVFTLYYHPRNDLFRVLLCCSENNKLGLETMSLNSQDLNKIPVYEKNV